MFRHVILFKFRAETPQAAIDEIFADLAAIRGKLDGLTGFDWGPSADLAKSCGYTHGFVMDFTDAAAHDLYQPHPLHVAVKKKIAPWLVDSPDAVLAFDYTA